jgi:glycosyltransferase involved in cell wall biosynthesis
MSSKRVTIVADELLGHVKTGGLGTAASFLALGLARGGHRVEVLYLGPLSPSEATEPWSRRFVEAGIQIRPLLRNARARVEPRFFAQMREVEQALLVDPPEIVITEDLGAPTYTALRMRRLGLAFADTRFIVNCYGTRRWITDMSGKARVLPGAHAVTALERASLELADAVVSPSNYLVGWMREQGWQLPEETFVIPYYTWSAATGESVSNEAAASTGRVSRIAFFGRLEERKGIAPFIEALNRLEPQLLQGLELAFVGRATPAWPAERIESMISQSVKSAARSLAFETDLDQPEAIASLRRPGTLAVLPTYGETFGNAVRECIEHRIPFLASRAGSVPELVAQEDWERTLFSPSADGIEEALRDRLTCPNPLVPARTGLDDSKLDDLWETVLERPAPSSPSRAGAPDVDVVVVYRGSQAPLARCLSALSQQNHRQFRVLVADASGSQGTPPVLPQNLAYEVLLQNAGASETAPARSAALEAASADWVVFLDQEDVPKPHFLEALVRARDGSDADAVSCSIEVAVDGEHVEHHFLGEPGGLGVLSNAYGTVALIRRSLLVPADWGWRAPLDPDWPLLARLNASGAHVVSIPSPLVTRRTRPGALEDDSGGALAVLQELEQALPPALAGLARIGAGLAANAVPPKPTAGRMHAIRDRVRGGLSALGLTR